jgi:hypothetical protein
MIAQITPDLLVVSHTRTLFVRISYRGQKPEGSAECEGQTWPRALVLCRPLPYHHNIYTLGNRLMIQCTRQPFLGGKVQGQVQNTNEWVQPNSGPIPDPLGAPAIQVPSAILQTQGSAHPRLGQ